MPLQNHFRKADWKSLPQLNDPSGLNQTANEADKLVKHLQPGNSEGDEH